jgi:hypothetical protein
MVMVMFLCSKNECFFVIFVVASVITFNASLILLIRKRRAYNAEMSSIFSIDKREAMPGSIPEAKMSRKLADQGISFGSSSTVACGNDSSETKCCKEFHDYELTYRKLDGGPQWGRNFGSVESVNVPYNCDYNGKKICCALLRDKRPAERQLQRQSRKSNTSSTLQSHSEINRKNCHTERIYVPSAYEELHIEMALNLSMIESFETRRKVLVDFITSQVRGGVKIKAIVKI